MVSVAPQSKIQWWSLGPMAEEDEESVCRGNARAWKVFTQVIEGWNSKTWGLCSEFFRLGVVISVFWTHVGFLYNISENWGGLGNFQIFWDGFASPDLTLLILSSLGAELESLTELVSLLSSLATFGDFLGMQGLMAVVALTALMTRCWLALVA